MFKINIIIIFYKDKLSTNNAIDSSDNIYITDCNSPHTPYIRGKA